MQFYRSLATAVVVVATGTALPAFADNGRGNGHGNGNGHGAHKRVHQERVHRDVRRDDHRYVANCPPGLAKKNPPCVPPGQVRNRDHDHYYPRVGDDFRVGDYIVIRDPGRYDLEDRRGWSYYRDDNNIYRVDSGTRRVLAVLELIDAFTN